MEGCLEREHHRFVLKDIISYGVLLVSMLVYYFTAYQAQERRLVILETKAARTEQDVREIKDDIKDVLKILRSRR
ncbi:MAG: hypothetical protein HS115_00040 [Spirochaetales bacterium]|nr:hypothetical protein [Spirochaetales bacterium]